MVEALIVGGLFICVWDASRERKSWQQRCETCERELARYRHASTGKKAAEARSRDATTQKLREEIRAR